MAQKKPALKKLKAYPDDNSLIFDASEMEWLKDKLGENDTSYLAVARTNQKRIDKHNLMYMVDILKARGKL